MCKYFPELKSLGGRVKVGLDLSNYATSSNLKNATKFDTSKVDTSKFIKKIDLANLKFNAGKLDIGKSKNVPTNLRNAKS